MNSNFDFSLEPGKQLKECSYKEHSPLVSVIIPFYNDYKYINQSVNCILNQTYPYFEILIVDDGTTDKKSLDKLIEIEKMDKRIRVLHKENGGLASARDYGADHASPETKYYLFIDSDDLFDETFLECAFWTLETNQDAGWAYSDSVGFDALEYTWNKWFNSNKMKKVNDLLSMNLIRKEAYKAVNGYELREKSVNEDWNFWLKLIAKGYYPVHMSFYGEWYRRKDSGELAKSRDNRKRALEIIHNTSKSIKKEVKAIQYPRYVYNNDDIVENIDIDVPMKKSLKKKNILMFIPWMVTGGADFFNLNLIKRLDKKLYNVTILSSIPNYNNLRQELSKYATVYDLTSFLDRKYWLSFVNYLIKKESINMFFITNSMFGYSIMPYLKNKYPSIPIIDYVHMEEWYYRDGGYAKMSGDYKEYIDKTLVCNNSTRDVIINHFKKVEDEISTVYIGVDTEKYDSSLFDKKTLLKKYNINNKNKFIISYICRITAQKRPMLFAKIVKKVLAKRNDILFVVAGDGEMLSQLKNELNDYIDTNVFFLGNVKNTEEVYAISDITLNCSIKEGLALTSYESLSMGVPVISSNVGGQKELINDNVGRIVPCCQNETDINDYNYSDEEINNYIVAIDEVINDLDMIKNNCRKNILDMFTLDKMAENMDKEFSKLFVSKKIKKCKDKEDVFKYIKDEFNYDIPSSYYYIREYQMKVYGRYYIDNKGKENVNYKLDGLRDKLWKFKLWQKITQSKLWRKIVRR